MSKGRKSTLPPNTEEKKSSFWSKFKAHSGFVITIVVAGVFTCIGAGFTFGRYYEQIKSDATIRDLENQRNILSIEYREKILDIREQYQNDIKDMKNEIRELQLTINKDNHEK